MNSNVKFGLILGFSIAAINLAGHFSEITYGQSAIALMVPILAVAMFAYYSTMKETREIEMGGYLTYGQAVKTGALVTLIASLIIALQTAVLWIFQGDYITDLQIANIENQYYEAGMSEEQIDQVLSLMEDFAFNPIMAVVGAFFNGMLSGMVVVLVMSIFMKNPPPEGFDPESQTPEVQ